jgi:Flp pilus assembly CpaE family ATPase
MIADLRVNEHPAARGGGERSASGSLVCVVGAHGGAGATRAAVALARDAGGDVCLIDADLSGGDAHVLLDLPARPGTVGLAALQEVDASTLAQDARRTAFGCLYEACPRPELSWLIRDGAVRDLARLAMRRATLVVVDVARPTGPSFEPVLDADVVVLIAHVNRAAAVEDALRRLVRSGVDERRVLVCATAPPIVERALGRVRRDVAVIDVERDDRLSLLVEGRLAAIGPRDRR